MPKICLGTVQFGMPYGVTNAKGQVPESEVSDLLLDAALSGVEMLDTAQAYGESESVLGRTLPSGHNFRLISKLLPQSKKSFVPSDCDIWNEAFALTCARLRCSSLDTLLLHSVEDLHKPGGEFLYRWLLGLRERGLVRRLGVSIYNSFDLDDVPIDLLDLVQLPLSIYDQRLLNDGTISRLRAHGCAIHARSLYLQGLLLIPAVKWPNWVAPEIRNHHSMLEQLAAEHKCSLLDLAIGFAHSQQDLESVVFGLCSRIELKQLMLAWRNPISPDCIAWNKWHLNSSDILDPRFWPPSRE